MSRNFKHYALRNSPRPLTGGHYFSLASAVAILGADGSRYYCYVSFSESLVREAGLKMPRGVSNLDPAYLHVTFIDGGLMRVSVCYINSPDSALLWEEKIGGDIPSWIKFHKVKGEQNADARPAQVQGSNADRNGKGPAAQGRATGQAWGHPDLAGVF